MSFYLICLSVWLKSEIKGLIYRMKPLFILVVVASTLSACSSSMSKYERACAPRYLTGTDFFRSCVTSEARTEAEVARYQRQASRMRSIVLP